MIVYADRIFVRGGKFIRARSIMDADSGGTTTHPTRHHNCDSSNTRTQRQRWLWRLALALDQGSCGRRAFELLLEAHYTMGTRLMMRDCFRTAGLYYPCYNGTFGTGSLSWPEGTGTSVTSVATPLYKL